MNITILGAGNGGTAMAADLKKKGHTVALLKTSSKGNTTHFSYMQENGGEVTIQKPESTATVNIDLVTYDFEEALTAKTELVVLFTPTNFHEDLIQKIIPFLHDGEIILLEPGYLSTAYFLKHAAHLDITIVEAESSPLDCRITSPGNVKVSFENVCNPIGIFPRKNSLDTMKKLESLDYHFQLVDNVIEAALQNPNLIVHTVGGIMSIPRIDYSKGNYWMYKEVFSPSVWNLVLSLDAEKINVLKKLNLPAMSYLDACSLRNSKSIPDEDAQDIFDDYAENHSVKGPTVSNSRYITEDVPEGLMLLESFGTFLDVETPVCSSLITIASACLTTDFRENGRTFKKLGIDNIKAILQD